MLNPLHAFSYFVQKTILHRLCFFGLYNVKTFWMSCQQLKIGSVRKIQISSFSLKIRNFGNTEPTFIPTWKNRLGIRDGHPLGTGLCFLFHCSTPAFCTVGNSGRLSIREVVWQKQCLASLYWQSCREWIREMRFWKHQDKLGSGWQWSRQEMIKNWRG